MENLYADITPISKAQEKLIKELSDRKDAARKHNSKRNNEIPLGKLRRFCSLCESELILTKKVEHIEGLNIDIPRYKCKTCGQSFSGVGLNLYTPNKKNKAIVFSMDSL